MTGYLADWFKWRVDIRKLDPNWLWDKEKDENYPFVAVNLEPNGIGGEQFSGALERVIDIIRAKWDHLIIWYDDIVDHLHVNTRRYQG